jgi:hypothetical protein
MWPLLALALALCSCPPLLQLLLMLCPWQLQLQLQQQQQPQALLPPPVLLQKGAVQKAPLAQQAGSCMPLAGAMTMMQQQQMCGLWASCSLSCWQASPPLAQRPPCMTQHLWLWPQGALSSLPTSVSQ